AGRKPVFQRRNDFRVFCRLRALLRTLDGGDQIFNQGSRKHHVPLVRFSFRTRPCFVFRCRSGTTPPQSSALSYYLSAIRRFSYCPLMAGSSLIFDPAGTAVPNRGPAVSPDKLFKASG